MWMHSKCFVMVLWQYDTITLFNFKYHGDKHVVYWFIVCVCVCVCVCARVRVHVCVCVYNWAKFCSEYLKEEGLLGRSRPIWIFKK